jgi:hypothetical protein
VFEQCRRTCLQAVHQPESLGYKTGERLDSAQVVPQAPSVTASTNIPVKTALVRLQELYAYELLGEHSRYDWGQSNGGILVLHSVPVETLVRTAFRSFLAGGDALRAEIAAGSPESIPT